MMSAKHAVERSRHLSHHNIENSSDEQYQHTRTVLIVDIQYPTTSERTPFPFNSTTLTVNVRTA